MDQEERRVAAELSRGQGARSIDGWPVDPAAPGDATVGPAASAASPVREAERAGRGTRALREVAETVLLAVLIFAAVRLVVANYRVDGPSMQPNLRDDQLLLVNVNAYALDLNRILDSLPGVDREEPWVLYSFGPPERGDIVVFDPPVDSDQPYIKRVIGLPGEEVTIEGGAVHVNGERLDEAYLKDPNSGKASRTPCGRRDVCRVTVEAGQVFVLGDNRSGSSDSREFGPVDVDGIVGKAWFSYWPLGAIGLVPHEDYPGMPEHPVPVAATPNAEADPERR